MKTFLWSLLFIVTLLTLTTGDLSISYLLDRLIHSFNEWNALRDERLPRLIVLLTTGASLAVAGATCQTLFQSPLASPSILGITPGSSLLVIIVMITGVHIQYPILWPLAAVLGALLSLLLVYSLSKRNGSISTHQLILTGVALSTLFVTIQGVLAYAFRDQWQLVQTLTEWEAGSTINRSWKHVHMQLPLAIIGLSGCYYYRKELDILSLGEAEALNLGVDVKTVQWRLFLCIALLSGGAIAAIGIIAFFGLVLPHLLRFLGGPCNDRLIPFCILAGAASLPALDLILRLLDIHMITIGNVSAIFGGFFFLTLLFGKKNRLQTC